jgi:preprotein translocase subunit SecD
VACYLLAGDAAVGTDAIDSAEASLALVRTDGDQAWQVDLVLTEDGIEAFNAAAAACYDRSNACPLGQPALVVDGEVVFAPSVQQRSFDRDAITVSGEFDEDQARALATTLARA